jgi:hypothetical protein
MCRIIRVRSRLCQRRCVSLLISLIEETVCVPSKCDIVKIFNQTLGLAVQVAFKYRKTLLNIVCLLDYHEPLHLRGCVQTSPGYSFIPSKQGQARRRELKAKVDQLQGTRTTLRRMKAELQVLAQGRSLLLPPELMGVIFGFYVHLYGQLPETLLLVCRTWYILALCQHTLWTNLEPLDQFGLRTMRPWAGTFIQSRIARSNPVPLNVDFSRISSIDMTPKVAMRIAGTRTLRPRIRNLVIARSSDTAFLLGDQPLLKSVTIKGGYPHPLDEVISNPKKFKLAEKNLTTLHLKCSPKLEAWPEGLLQRLHTLEVTPTSDPRILQECWTMVQKSTTLHSLHIAGSYGCTAPLSHPSVQRLSVIYPSYLNSNHVYSLEDVRFPRLRDITIEAWDPKALRQLKLIDTPVLSLRLACHRSYGGPGDLIEEQWVDAVVPLLRSVPRLEEVELLAESSLIVKIIETLEKEPSLCAELRVFTVIVFTKKLGEGEAATSEELERMVAAVISQRLQGLLTQ